MQRTSAENSTFIRPGVSGYRDKNDQDGSIVPGTRIAAIDRNAVQEELMALVDYAAAEGLLDRSGNPITAKAFDPQNPSTYTAVLETTLALVRGRKTQWLNPINIVSGTAAVARNQYTIPTSAAHASTVGLLIDVKTGLGPVTFTAWYKDQNGTERSAIIYKRGFLGQSDSMDDAEPVPFPLNNGVLDIAISNGGEFDIKLINIE